MLVVKRIDRADCLVRCSNRPLTIGMMFKEWYVIKMVQMGMVPRNGIPVFAFRVMFLILGFTKVASRVVCPDPSKVPELFMSYSGMGGRMPDFSIYSPFGRVRNDFSKENDD